MGTRPPAEVARLEVDAWPGVRVAGVETAVSSIVT